MEVRLIRHPAIDLSANLCLGHSNVDLSTEGFSSLPSLAVKAVSFGPSRIISSDLRRCRLLAEAVAIRTDIPVELNSTWREMNFGSWERRPWNSIREEDPQTFEKWTQRFTDVAPPDGESLAALQQRILSAWQKATAIKTDKLLIITHAGPIRALLCAIQGYPLAQAFELEVPYGAQFNFHWYQQRWHITTESGVGASA